MSKKIKPQNNAANITNPNSGQDGVNKQYQQSKSNTDRQIKGKIPKPSTKQKG